MKNALRSEKLAAGRDNSYAHQQELEVRAKKKRNKNLKATGTSEPLE